MEDIAQVIKYEGDNSTFIWKHHIEDFNSMTQLVVHESQEAVFFMNGQALDSFGPGRHTLETQNIPLVKKFFNKVTGDQTPFTCSVYFINKTEQMAIKWGTDSKVEYVEPTYGFPLQIGASGEMSLEAVDSRKLLIKIVGTERLLSQGMLVDKFRGFLMAKIKTYLSNLIREEKINIFQIDERMTEMSAKLHERLIPDFADYGVALERFFVTNIVKPEGDPSYRRFKEIHFRQYADVAEAELRQRVGVIDQQTEAQRMVIESQGMAQKRAQEGYSYGDERGFDVAEKVASNEAVGEFTNMGVGMGVMAGVGGTVGGAVGGMMSDTMGSVLESNTPKVASEDFDGTSPEGLKCADCGFDLPVGAKFCVSCGVKVVEEKKGEMICAKCETVNPKGKFCLECGSPLINKCPNCQTEMPLSSKFCLECGTKMGSNL